MGATPALTSALVDRGCRVEDVAGDDPPGARDGDDALDADALDAGHALDAVVVHGGAVAPEVLASVAERLGAGGRVVVTAANVTHGAVRLALLEGRFPAAGAGPVFDRDALQRLFDGAGLVVIDRLEIRRGLDEAGVDVDLDAFKPELLATLEDDPDAQVAALVFVGRKGTGDAAGVVGGTDGVSLAEDLQNRLRRAEIEADRARADADARGERVRELEEALRARLAELDDLHGELAHARMDLELKDAFSLEMRALVNDYEVTAHHARLELQGLQQSVDHLQASLREAHALLAGRMGEMAVVQAEYNRVAEELTAVRNRASYLIVEGIVKALEPVRPATRLARRIARGLSRVSGRGGGGSAGSAASPAAPPSSSPGA
jgi:hypothetical protein